MDVRFSCNRRFTTSHRNETEFRIRRIAHIAIFISHLVCHMLERPAIFLRLLSIIFILYSYSGVVCHIGEARTIPHTCEPSHEKMCLMSHANNKGADQPAHPRSLISAFVVRCLDSKISLNSIAEISRL